MRKSLKTCIQVLLAGALLMALTPLAEARKGKHPTDIAEILYQMNEASKGLKAVSADLEYTKVTVLVDDKSTESGQLFFSKSKPPEIIIKFQKPEPKTLLFKKNQGYIYLPKINQVQEYDLAQKGDLLQQFLLLGFGTDTGELKKVYNVKYLQEEDMEGDATAELELTPRKPNTAAQISKIQLWVSEDSWLPKQQKFFESGGDYAIAHYTRVKRRDKLPGSTFELNAPSNAKRVKMN